MDFPVNWPQRISEMEAKNNTEIDRLTAVLDKARALFAPMPPGNAWTWQAERRRREDNLKQAVDEYDKGGA